MFSQLIRQPRGRVLSRRVSTQVEADVGSGGGVSPPAEELREPAADPRRSRFHVATDILSPASTVSLRAAGRALRRLRPKWADSVALVARSTSLAKGSPTPAFVLVLVFADDGAGVAAYVPGGAAPGGAGEPTP